MGFTNIIIFLLALSFSPCNAANPKLFREYIGAESSSVKLSDVPINSSVDFHFILAFAIDYTDDHKNPSPTNGIFNVFWSTDHLSPQDIVSFKSRHPNAKFAVSLGGDSVCRKKAKFAPKSIDSWVQNAVTSLTAMIQHYNLDGIDVDYEHFKSDPETFAECIGRLITNLKRSRTISFASIAPYDDRPVQSRYMALWSKFDHVIDYVNFQFYAYDKLGVSEFVRLFNEQSENYRGGQILASFMSKGEKGLRPDDGFFEACEEIRNNGKLGGIFVWCADESEELGFGDERMAQEFLASG